VTGRPAEKVSRDKTIEALMAAILQGAQVKLDIGKSTTVTLSGKSYKGKKLSIKQPDPPHELVAEGVALFTSEKADAHVIACLKAKQDQEAERCPKVLAELLAIPPP
jgi:hypothetical protein